MAFVVTKTFTNGFDHGDDEDVEDPKCCHSVLELRGIIEEKKRALIKTIEDEADGLKALMTQRHNGYVPCDELRRRAQMTKSVNELQRVKEELTLTQSDSKKTKSELEATLEKLQKTKNDLNAALTDAQKVKNEYTAAQLDLQTVKIELNSALSEKKALQDAWMQMDGQMESVVKIKDGYHAKILKLENASRDELAQKDSKIAHQDRKIIHLEADIESLKHQLVNVGRKIERAEVEELTKIKAAEERLVSEMNREKQSLQDELSEIRCKLQRSEFEYKKLQASTRETVEKTSSNKKEQDYFEKLYNSYKEKMQADLLQKESKIAQQDRQIVGLEREVESLKHQLAVEEEERSKLKATDSRSSSTAATNSPPRSDRAFEDLVTRLRMTEEHLGDVNREKRSAESELDEIRTKLQHSEANCQKLYTNMREAVDKIATYKKEKEYYEDLYKSSGNMTRDEMVQKDSKIAQQDRQIELLEGDVESLKHQLVLVERQINRMEDEERSRIKATESRSTSTAMMESPRHAHAYNDLATRLRMTEEHLGELNRENQSLHDELSEMRSKFQKSDSEYKKLYVGMREAVDKNGLIKKEKDYFEKLYNSYKEKMQADLLQKDSKIAQQDKLITLLQCRIVAPKKMCCFVPDKKPPGRMSMDELGLALDQERGKNVELSALVRRLQQQLNEKRMRRSFSAERLPMVNEN